MSVGFTVEDTNMMLEKGYVLDESEFGRVFYPREGIRILGEITVKCVEYPWITCFEVEGIKIKK